MAWAVVLLGIILGAFSALRSSGRQTEFRRGKKS